MSKEEVIAKARAAAAANKLDAIVASSPENVSYTAGTFFITQKTVPDRLGLVVIAGNDEPVFIYCTIETNSAKEESWLSNQRGYKEHAEKPVHLLADVLGELGIKKGRIGIETRHLVQRDYEELKKVVPDAVLVPADEVFDEIRAMKSQSEIEILGKASLATDAAIRAAFGRALVGMTELDVAGMLLEECRSRGGEKVLHLVVATGQSNHKVHADPGETRLAPSSVLRTDFGMTWGRYNSDVARTAFIAPIKPRQESDYNTLEEIHQETMAAMKPGVRASDVFNLCADKFAKTDLDFWVPHIGHSLGLGLHEKPMLQPYDHTVLQAGMVFMVEPAITTEDGLYHTEDMVEITETGPRILSRSGDWTHPFIVNG
jgi:Xaa-Pro dipeptidase